MSPQKPKRLHPLAERVLRALAEHPEAGEVILGGYFALQHFLEYRETHDIDAWWRTRAEPGTKGAIRRVMQNLAAEENLKLRERRFGETLSFELVSERGKEFSFQIALRSVELEPPVLSAWPPILIETLADNVGAKMNALVERGAPRDFRDIMQIVQTGLSSAEQCWDLWSRKNPGQAAADARTKVRHHLLGIAARRPLESIADPRERADAARTREWFARSFLRT